MGMLDRVSTLLRANINDMIDRAEDPEKVVKQLIMDMNNQLLQVKTQVAASIADEKLLYQRYQDNAEKATDWQQRAELAVEKGQDDMAREALSRRNSFQQTADGFKTQYDQQAQQVESLKTALHQLEAKIQDASTKEELLIARARRAKAETQIRTTLSAHALLHRLLQVEQEMGRIRREKWEPRLIDLDVLLYGDHILSSQELIVPHPLMHERRFVLQPLAELIPDFRHPTLQVSIGGLLESRVGCRRFPDRAMVAVVGLGELGTGQREIEGRPIGFRQVLSYAIAVGAGRAGSLCGRGHRGV